MTAALTRVKEWLGIVEVSLETAGIGMLPYGEQQCPRGAHEWVRFAGGSGCLHCPAWSFGARTGEPMVEQHPAGPMNLGAAIGRITAQFVDPAQPQLPTLTGPVRQPIDHEKVTRIVTEMLPIVRQDVSLTHLLQVAEKIALLP